MSFLVCKTYSFYHCEIKNGFGLEVCGRAFIDKCYVDVLSPSSVNLLLPLFVAFNYQLLAVMVLKHFKWATLSCGRPEPAKDNGVRDRRSN